MIGMNAQTGQAIALREHVQQSIANILSTPIGSLVMRRQYGSVLPYLIGAPLNDATMMRVYAATVIAIREWEKRVQIVSQILRVELSAQGRAALRLHARLSDGSEATFDVPITRGVPA